MKHPVQILSRYNAEMKCWETMLQSGNFATKADADKWAKAVKHFLETNANANFTRAQ